MIDDYPIYGLDVYHSGGQLAKVFGRRADLMNVVDKWRNDCTAQHVIVDGFCDTADRAEVVCSFVREEVSAMILWRHS